MAHELRGRAAIIGIGTTPGWENPGMNSLDQLAVAVSAACDDAGIAVSDIDGLFAATLSEFFPKLSVAEYLGLRPAYMDGTNIGGSSFVGHLLPALMALDAGLCKVACICYGSDQRSQGARLKSLSERMNWEADFEPRSPISGYALATARHMHEFGTTREQLAEVAVAARAWARLNPQAYVRDALYIEDVLASRMVSDPLSLLDCCLVTDGGGALILVRADRARDSRKPAVYVLGAASATTHRQISSMPDLTRTAAAASGARAFSMSGLRPEDVDLLQLYDAFTINPILFLEDLGFCAKGEGGPFVSGGRIAPGGALPVNTNGGGLSCCHPGMYGIFALIEAVTQLRGDAGDRQVAEPSIALAHGNGGQLSSQVTALLGTVQTL
ncbi:acetyl-CoA acetyltransferase [Achromobacter sp. Marseille-Q4962]|uniref:acetyl-CoA acetyltransferase n=1 Tax=Achromobacter sp. Marseille-Q4962 TaxID=2942202 RepID=UPI002073F490|nr:acetyl-CoA acetyltransferase [Achromobacter sp. Marseille-Q4962]